jgi:hypothetical protein
MTNAQPGQLSNRNQALDIEGLDEVLTELVIRLPPKQATKAKRELERFASQLETYQGRTYPMNVVPLRVRRVDAVDLEQRQRKARMVRDMIELAF